MINFVKSILVAVTLSLFAGYTNAQESEIPKTIQSFSLNIGAGNRIFSGAVSWNRTHGLFSSNKLRIGYGLRFSAFTGSDLTYITAPARLTADESTIDSLFIKSPFSMSLNASIHIEYFFNSRLKAGFNIDALGLGFGPQKEVSFISSDNSGTFPEFLKARPTPFNLLLVGDNDIGQLKSEFFIAYAVTEKLWLRGGMDMTFAEYTTNALLAHNNDRFRYKAIMIFAGVSFNPFASND